MIIIKTNMGDIEIELNQEQAPKTVENFLAYVKAGDYDGTIFHRVIQDFMIQGGGFEPGMHKKPVERDAIRNEANNGLQNKKGTIAMARTSDPHSASNQFFINCTDNNYLDFKGETETSWGYCVFGEVKSGIDVVEKISHVKTTLVSFHKDVPAEDIIIESIVEK